MKTSDLLIIGGSVAAIFVIVRVFNAKKAAASTAATAAKAGVPSNIPIIAQADGITYYANGTAVTDDGSYFNIGMDLFNPLGMFLGTAS
jgi:hypothetical protein